MPIPKFKGTVTNGKLDLVDRESFKKHLYSLNGLVDLTIKKHKKRRSLDQNAFYWGVPIKMLSEDTGYETDEIHQFLAKKFLGKIKIVMGIEMLIIPTTTKLTTKEFKEYLEKIQRWAAQERNMVIPDPEKVDY